MVLVIRQGRVFWNGLKLAVLQDMGLNQPL